MTLTTTTPKTLLAGPWASTTEAAHTKIKRTMRQSLGIAQNAVLNAFDDLNKLRQLKAGRPFTPTEQQAIEELYAVKRALKEAEELLNQRFEEHMKYAIINTVDRPYERLVCEIVDGKAYYMNREREPFLREHDAMELRPNTTDMVDFGFNVQEDAGVTHFFLARDSVAKYEDGRIRPWQGCDTFTLPRVKL